jgi:hypothetical protein
LNPGLHPLFGAQLNCRHEILLSESVARLASDVNESFQILWPVAPLDWPNLLLQFRGFFNCVEE